MRNQKRSEIIVLAILFVFFLQVLSDFIQSIYAFGLLVTAFTVELAAVLLLFTPVVLIFVRGVPSRRWTVALALVAMLGRLVEPLLYPGGRLMACGISVGAFMLLFPMLVAGYGRQRTAPIRGWSVASGLLIAVMLLITFRSAGSSLDISEVGIYQSIAWGLALLAAWLMWRLDASRPRAAGLDAMDTVEQGAGNGDVAEENVPVVSLRRNEVSTRRVVGLCIGLASVIIMLYFAIANPMVIARWTEYRYVQFLPILGAALFLYAWLPGLTRFPYLLTVPIIAAWNALFVLMLVLTILPHQVIFPPSPGAYPFEAAEASPWAQVPLYAMLVLSPVVFIDFMLFLRQLSAERPSMRQLGVGFSWAGLFVLVMVFLQVFTTIYDYAAPIGPLFRDRFWLVYMLAGVALALPLLLIRSESPPLWDVPLGANPPGDYFTATPVAVLLLAVLFTVSNRIEYRGISAPSGQLRVMTYNIQQGFDKDGNANLPGQLDVIRQVEPDVLGLQESDTARVANGNVDAVRYFANNLGMYSYYGPTTTTGTFGIALLSKYPINNPRTFFFYSTGEQTAAIQAEITVNGKTHNVFVTHLGNDGPMVQLQNVLQRVDGLPNVILMGDFNFNPSTPQYALATQSLEDAWMLRWPGGTDVPELGEDGRIDQIFVSHGLQVEAAQYVVDPASDHPYLFAVVR